VSLSDRGAVGRVDCWIFWTRGWLAVSVSGVSAFVSASTASAAPAVSASAFPKLSSHRESVSVGHVRTPISSSACSVYLSLFLLHVNQHLLFPTWTGGGVLDIGRAKLPGFSKP
jgi:hypothetical protein